MNASHLASRSVVFETRAINQLSNLSIKTVIVIGLLIIIIAVFGTLQSIPRKADIASVSQVEALIAVPVPTPPAQAFQPQATPCPPGYAAQPAAQPASIPLSAPSPQPVPTPPLAGPTQ